MEIARAPPPLVPPLALAACTACVAGAAALANFAVLAALFKTSKTGLFSIILQLAVADLIFLGTAIIPELWSCNARTWYFGNRFCVAYQGLSVFSSMASLYLVTAIALHTLATIRLEEKAEKRRVKRSGRDEEDEIKTSRHSLVASSDSSTPPRTMNVDYRLSDTRVPVTLPVIFVWVLSASLSLPEFVLASTDHLGQGVMVCTLNSSHQLNMQSMLTIFNLFLPMFILSTASALIVIKLKSKRRPLEIDNCESVAALKLSLWLIVVCGVMCAPRSVFSAYRVYSSTDNETSSEFEENVMSAISLAVCGTYLVAILIRPLLCVILLPPLRKSFLSGSGNTDNV